jgi:hypothetical protein
MSDTRSAGMTLFVMIVATLYFGKEVLMPVTLALLLAFVLAPMVNLLRRAHLGRVPSVLLGVTLGLCVVLAIGGVVGSQIAQLTTDIPKYAATVETKVSNVRNFTIGRLSELADKVGAKKAKSSTSSADGSSAASPQPAPTNAPAPAATQASGSSPFELAERYLSPVLSPFATFGIVFIVAVFALLQKEDLRDRMIRLLGSNDLHGTTVAIDDGGRRLSRYFLTQLIINTAFGVVIGAGHFSSSACPIRCCGASSRRCCALFPAARHFRSPLLLVCFSSGPVGITLPPAWVDKSPVVLCISGRGPLDETTSGILVQLLGKHGFTGRLVTYDEVSREKIATLDIANVAIVCVSFLHINGSPAHLRYLIQRLRHRLPKGVEIIVGIWPSDEAAQHDDAARTLIGATRLTGSLEGTVSLCVQAAIKAGEVEAPAPREQAPVPANV